MKKLYSFSIALLVLLLMAASASAENSNKERKMTDAVWPLQSGGSVCISLTDYGDYTEIRVSSFDYSTGYQWDGSLITTDKVFVQNKLDSASLSEVSIPVHEYSQNIDGVLSVEAEWIGVGPISTVKDQYTGITTKSRASAATGSITGDLNQDLSTTLSGVLTVSK